MGNLYIRQQCQNMILTLNIFEQACVQAATKDDGGVSSEERAALDRIQKANRKFIESLNKTISAI